jgi:asparagine synthase (glutamine-hydrolysing)
MRCRPIAANRIMLSGRELFDQAVAAATADIRHVAISASGGLDSSAIAATAARLGRAERITCYTLVPPVGLQIDVGPYKYLDERNKMAALARMYPALDLHLVTPERLHPFEEDDTRLFARVRSPILGAANIGPYSYVYDAIAAAGHRSMLVGDCGNFGLTWKGLFSLMSLLGGGQWALFGHELMKSARQNGRSLAGTFAAEIIKPAGPPWVRRAIHWLKGRDPDSVARFSALNPDYVAERKLIRRWRTEGFDPWFVARGWNAARRRARYLFDHNQFARDLKAMTGELYGFETRDPHADRRLLEFALAVPEPMFRRDGIPRSFARAVFADRLPPEILSERRRGARSDIAIELERLDTSPLARRLIDLPRLRGLLEQWPKDEHAAEQRREAYRIALNRAVHVGRFIRWIEGGNA